ncbi:MAG: pitrilysin family protein [Coriobacteriales bacterium]
MFYEKTVLDNGITVITESMEGVRSVALGFWVRVGGRDEAPAEYGMSHFMEHMLFKGTKTRSALDISAAFDALGAEFNAFTSREYTCFYTRLIDERLKLGFEILADMLVNSTFAHKDIVTEREVVLEEIARSQDTPEDYVYDVFSKAMFPQDALGCPVLGASDTVSSFDTEEMLRYHQAHYTTGNVTVVACGSVDHESIVEMAVRCLGGLVTGSRLERDAVQPQDRVMLSCVKKDSEQANIVLGAPTIVNNDPRRFVYSLLDIIIGGGMSSRLFQEIREKRGLVYSVYASSQLYEGAGIFEMYAGTRPENIAEVVKVATEQFALAAQDGVSEEELARAKELAAGSFVLGTESTRTRMSRLGRLAALDLPMDSIDDIIEKYRVVTLDEVNEAARELFSREMTLAVVSPYKQEKVERMLR